MFNNQIPNELGAFFKIPRFNGTPSAYSDCNPVRFEIFNKSSNRGGHVVNSTLFTNMSEPSFQVMAGNKSALYYDITFTFRLRVTLNNTVVNETGNLTLRVLHCYIYMPLSFKYWQYGYDY